jgi:pimeloyl-ACP methyl ester carboxylesterase
MLNRLRLFSSYLASVILFSFCLTLIHPNLAQGELPQSPATIVDHHSHFIQSPENGRTVFYEVWPGKPGSPVYLTINGLLYKQDYWNSFLTELSATGATIIRYSFSADPDSLVGRNPSNKQKPFSLPGIVGEIESVLNAEGLNQVILLPLSFGSIAIEFALERPERVERLVMMSPMVLPMDYYDLGGQAARSWLEGVRNIWGETAYEIQWSLTMEPTVRTLVLERVRAMTGYIPNGLSEADVMDGAIEKIKATRHFNLRDYAASKLPRIDLILSGGESAPMLKDQKDFWAKLNKGSKGNFVLIREAAHAIPADTPVGATKILGLLQVQDGTKEKPFVNFEVDKAGEEVKSLSSK